MLAAFQLLVQRVGCRVDDEDEDGRTALHCVCGSHVKRSRRGRRHYVRLLKLLVDAGADVNRKFHGFTPLHLLHESPWALRYFLMETEARANGLDHFHRLPLVWSLRNPHFPAVGRIPLSAFQSKMKPEDFRVKDSMGNSMIHLAVLRVQWDKLGETKRLIQRLVRAGADVNQQNQRLRTALFYLVPKPDTIELADYLVTHFHADVNLCDADGFTVVHIAAILGKMDYVALFLPHMKCNVRTANGETVRSCLEQYCDPSSVTEEVAAQLPSMERRGQTTAERVYVEPFTVWRYVHLLDRFRDLFSLYLVDAFNRYRGGNPLTINDKTIDINSFGFLGRSLFIDFFHHINYSVICKRRAKEFLRDVADWKGSSSKTLLDLIDQYSVVIEPSERKEDEPSQIFWHVSRMVKDLMKQVAQRDAREPEESRHGWELDVLPVGSAADGSKILLPDEYDFLVVFRRFRPGDKPVIGEDYTYQVERFRMHLIRCMQEMDSQLILLVDSGHQQPPPPVWGFQFVDCELRRICLNIRLTWWGADATSPLRGLPISIDLTPVFQFQGWDNQSGFRPLRSLASLPDWFILLSDQILEHFRPVSQSSYYSLHLSHHFEIRSAIWWQFRHAPRRWKCAALHIRRTGSSSTASVCLNWSFSATTSSATPRHPIPTSSKWHCSITSKKWGHPLDGATSPATSSQFAEDSQTPAGVAAFLISCRTSKCLPHPCPSGKNSCPPLWTGHVLAILVSNRWQLQCSKIVIFFRFTWYFILIVRSIDGQGLSVHISIASCQIIGRNYISTVIPLFRSCVVYNFFDYLFKHARQAK